MRPPSRRGSSKEKEKRPPISCKKKKSQKKELAWTGIAGADLYVVRVAKRGLGCAKPCWRW
jgi:hypothetical protein